MAVKTVCVFKMNHSLKASARPHDRRLFSPKSATIVAKNGANGRPILYTVKLPIWRFRRIYSRRFSARRFRRLSRQCVRGLRPQNNTITVAGTASTENDWKCRINQWPIKADNSDGENQDSNDAGQCHDRRNHHVYHKKHLSFSTVFSTTVSTSTMPETIVTRPWYTVN